MVFCRSVCEEYRLTMGSQAEGGIDLKDIGQMSSEQKLDLLLTNVIGMRGEFQQYKEEINKTVLEHGQALSSHSTDITDLQVRMDNLAMRVNILEGNDRKKDMVIKELMGKFTMQSVQAMENNILIYKIPEQEHESHNDLAGLTEAFLTEQMKIPTQVVKEMSYYKLHRLGPPTTRAVPRPILLKVSPHSRRVIFQHIKNVDTSQFGISGHYPSEVQEERYALKDKMKHDPVLIQASSKKLINDKLIVNGKLYKNPETASSSAPEQYDTHDTDYDTEVPRVREGETLSEKGSVFKVYTAQITSRKDSKMVLDSITAKLKETTPTHTVYAYRLSQGHGSSIVEYREDDREYGASRNILRALQKFQKIDCIVIVARWYGGENLGKKRLFDIYYQLARNA